LSILLSDDAAAHIRNTMIKEVGAKNSAIRFLVKSGGCSGFSYDVKTEPSKAWELPSKDDNAIMSKDVRILVDNKSMKFLKGMTVDYKATPFGGHFIFTNPNAAGGCGCGVSFYME
jgi:iron-sulfur cluster assembly accessory protein